VTIIVAGTVRVPADKLEGFRPHMLAMLTASRAEDGCLEYSYAQDVAEPSLIRVYEAWRDQAALDAHFQTLHMAAWRAAWPAFGVGERRLKLYEASVEQAL
jgi:quinol monooxygenase YgiN